LSMITILTTNAINNRYRKIIIVIILL
jgi:hypothetical protein